MKKVTSLLLVLVSLTLFSSVVRLKDIAFFRGARDNQLFGVGLVVGLNGTGDSGNVHTPLLAEMVKKFGIQIPADSVKSRNTAIVMVLADIPPFAKNGMRMNCVVASLADAKSLEGGFLVQTPLYGADGRVYAVAQGPVSVGGLDARESASLQKRYKVVGYIPGGAIVERDIPSSLSEGDSVTIFLREPNVTMAARVASAINKKFEMILAKAVDPSTIRVAVPTVFRDDVITFLAILEDVEVQLDSPARIVVNERTGTVVIGGNVRLTDFVVSYGNFTVSVSSGRIGDKEATVANLVDALKAAGATPQDIIAILQVLHKAGYIAAELVVM